MTRLKKSKDKKEVTEEITETSYEDQPESSYEVLSGPISEVSIIASEIPNLVLAKLLEGTPKKFPIECGTDLEILCGKGIAVNFGSQGWARGVKWRSYIRKER